MALSAMVRAMASTGSKTSWIDVVDRAMNRADRALDRFRKTPRRRLDGIVPTPPVPVDPFAPAVAAATAKSTEPVDKPLGDPGLPAQIFGRRTCDASGRAVALLLEHSVVARMINMDDADNVGLETRLIRDTKRYKTPYVYVRGEYIGGFEELAALVKSGKLT